MKSTINNATNNKQVEEYSIKLKNIGCFEVYKTCDRKRGIVYFLCLEGDIVESFNSFVDLKKFCKKYNGKKFVFTDCIKDRNGNYHNDVVYEIILNKKIEK